MRERRKESTDDQCECQRATATERRAAVVKNVLCHREAQRGQRRVHDAIDNAVEFIFLPEEKDEEDQRLASLLDDRGRDDGSESFTGFGVRQNSDDACAACVEEKREEGGGKSAPKESRGQHPEWLGFITIDPQHESDVDRDRDCCREQTKQQSDGSCLDADQQQDE